MRAYLLLLPVLLLALAAPAGARGGVAVPTPTARPGDVLVSLGFASESERAWAALEKLGYRHVSEQRVMVALGGGKRGCIAAYRGWLPGSALAAARKVAGVNGVHPVPDDQR